MQIIDSISQMQAWATSVRDVGESIGFVPTLGCLHHGHAHLLNQAKANNDRVVLSVFVNPIQFRRKSFDVYPRDLQADLKLAEQCGVDAVFAPSVEEMYPQAPSLDWLFDLQDGHSDPRDPQDFTTDLVGADESMHYIRVPDRLALRMDGKLHPWHFDGVATVVRLLHQAVTPDHAYYGEKDVQQLAILQAMNTWLGTQTKIVPTPIIRDPDGLASSSRLVLLDPSQRAVAVAITNAVSAMATVVKAKSCTADQLFDQFAQDVKAINIQGINLEIDSIECVHPQSLDPVDCPSAGTIIYAAYLIDGIRLAETCQIGV